MTCSLRPNPKNPSKTVCLYCDIPNLNFLAVNVGDAKDKVLAMSHQPARLIVVSPFDWDAFSNNIFFFIYSFSNNFRAVYLLFNTRKYNSTP